MTCLTRQWFFASISVHSIVLKIPTEPKISDKQYRPFRMQDRKPCNNNSFNVYLQNIRTLMFRSKHFFQPASVCTNHIRSILRPHEVEEYVFAGPQNRTLNISNKIYYSWLVATSTCICCM